MDDLISRQAAIDFIDAGHLVNPNEPRWSDNEVVNFLKSRPSTQPDIIRCKDCKHWDGEYRNGFWYFEQCSLNEHVASSEDFCSWAERQEE